MGIKRVTDLFVEGIELLLGEDETGPVLLWVNKLNPFQVEEARRDGAARRAVRMAKLCDEGNEELIGVRAELATWDDERLVQAFVATRSDDLQLAAMNDLDTDTEIREAREAAERLPDLLDDEGVPADAPQRQEVEELSATWVRRFGELHREKVDEALVEARQWERDYLEGEYLKRWRERETLDEFMESRRATQLFFSLRECRGNARPGGGWDHTPCDHSRRWLESRAEVRELPGPLIELALETYDEISVSIRQAGNSDAPMSSSASSEPSSSAEAGSTPSTPEGTPSASPTT